MSTEKGRYIIISLSQKKISNYFICCRENTNIFMKISENIFRVFADKNRCFQKCEIKTIVCVSDEEEDRMRLAKLFWDNIGLEIKKGSQDVSFNSDSTQGKSLQWIINLAKFRKSSFKRYWEEADFQQRGVGGGGVRQ